MTIDPAHASRHSRTSPDAVALPRLSWRETARLYLKVTKPRIIPLLLITTLCAMFIAANHLPSAGLVLITMFAGAFMTAGSHAINAYIDRDIDHLMKRTRSRPVVSGQIPATHALIFGIVLGVIGFALYAVFVNLLTAALGLAGLLFYVFIYSLWLKRLTVQNIVIGGAAGAFPPLVGWAAVAHSLSPAALVLFAIIFLWTPPHFWALALVMRKDYAEAGIPMLPVVVGEARTVRQIVVYTVLLLISTLLLAIGNVMGTVYLAAAVLLGAGFVYYVVKLAQGGGNPAAKRLFHYSNAYLALLFLVMVIDHLVR